MVDLQAVCPSCLSLAEDCGRDEDWSGPYSPYEPIAEYPAIQMIDFSMTANCKHAVYCKACNQTSDVLIGLIG